MRYLPILFVLLASCGAGNTTCKIIDLAKTACDVLPIRYLDDNGKPQTVNVPKSELRKTAQKQKAKDVKK